MGCKISIIIPVFNIENYISKCIESVTKQTYTNIEILLIDDGSTDYSGHICEQYAKIDGRIKVIHKTNGGLVSARKAGAEKATGDYICNVDGDDWIDTDRICNLAKVCSDTDVDMVYMDGYIKEYDNRCILCSSDIAEGLYQKDQIIKDIFPMIIDTNVCFKRDIKAMQVCWGIKRELYQKLCRIMNDRVSWGEDYVHILCCILEADTIFLMKEQGYHYIERMSSISHVLNRNSLDGLKLWFEILQKQLCLHDCGEQVRHHFTFLKTWYLLQCDYSIFLLNKRDYLYPYPTVKKGSSIAVYGAGAVGSSIVDALCRINDWHLAVWVDKYVSDQSILGYTVEKVQRLLETFYDYVIIAVLDAGIVLEIEESLLEMGIPVNKIAKMDASIICEDALPYDFTS